LRLGYDIEEVLIANLLLLLLAHLSLTEEKKRPFSFSMISTVPGFLFLFFLPAKKKMRRLQPGVPMLLQLYGLISENCVPPVLVINVYQLSEPEKLCTVLGKKNELRKIR
jgi:hypothetical protein